MPLKVEEKRRTGRGRVNSEVCRIRLKLCLGDKGVRRVILVVAGQSILSFWGVRILPYNDFIKSKRQQFVPNGGKSEERNICSPIPQKWCWHFGSAVTDASWRNRGGMFVANFSISILAVVSLLVSETNRVLQF